MGVEIEYKFLVRDDGWRDDAGPGSHYRQGYLAVSADSGIRVNLVGERAWLTIKKAQTVHRRLEFEYPVPLADAETMYLALCAGARIEKRRYRVPYAGHVWEVDEFDGDNAGLVVAEIELQDEREHFQRPPWVGADVSADVRYYATHLARTPWSTW